MEPKTVTNYTIEEIRNLVSNLCKQIEPKKYRDLKNKIHNVYSFKDVDTNIPQAADFLKFLEKNVKEAFSLHENHPDWRNEITIDSSVISHGADYWQDLIPLMMAHNVKDSPYYEDTALKSLIKSRLEHGNQFISLIPDTNHNWWAWDIGIIRNLLKILFLDLDRKILTEEQFQICAEYILYQGLNPKSMGFNSKWASGLLSLKTGQNSLWVQSHLLLTGILFELEEYVKVSIHNIFLILQENISWTGDGIAPDGSFHQHCRTNITGINMGYGSEYIETASFIFYIMDGIQPVPKSTQNAFKSLLNFLFWNTWKGNMNFWTKGRSLSRSHKAHRNGGYVDLLDHIKPLLFIESMDFKEEIMQEISQRGENKEKTFYPFAQPYYFTLKMIKHKFLEEYKKVQYDDNSVGVKHFPHGRLLISKTNVNLIAIQLNDTHHKTYFSIHSENKKGYHLNEGSIFWLTNSEKMDNNKQYAWPWDDVMGATNLSGRHAIREIHAQSDHAILGSLENIGNCGFHFNQNGISALKSYHIFENFLILIGTKLRRKWNIKDLYSPLKRVKTTIYHESIPNRGSEMHNNCICAINNNYFNNTVKMEEKILNIKENPKEINEQYGLDCDSVSQKWKILSLDHGRNPKNQTYCYCIGLNGNETEVKSMISKDLIKTFNNETGHEVKFSREINSSIVYESSIFYKGGKQLLGDLSTSGTLLKIINMKKKTLKLFIAPEITSNILKQHQFPLSLYVGIPFNIAPFPNVIKNLNYLNENGTSWTYFDVKFKNLLGKELELRLN